MIKISRSVIFGSAFASFSLAGASLISRWKAGWSIRLLLWLPQFKILQIIILEETGGIRGGRGPLLKLHGDVHQGSQY